MWREREVFGGAFTWGICPNAVDHSSIYFLFEEIEQLEKSYWVIRPGFSPPLTNPLRFSLPTSVPPPILPPAPPAFLPRSLPPPYLPPSTSPYLPLVPTSPPPSFPPSFTQLPPPPASLNPTPPPSIPQLEWWRRNLPVHWWEIFLAKFRCMLSSLP